MRIETVSRTLPADIQTPVGLYLKVRDLYPRSALLESSDYHSSENSYSFIGVGPLASFTVQDGRVAELYPSGRSESYQLVQGERTLEVALNEFLGRFEVAGEQQGKGRLNGFFGYTSYDAIRYFENVVPSSTEVGSLPELCYILYRFVIAVNHLRSEMTITENIPEGGRTETDELISVLESRNFPLYDFHSEGEVVSPVTDDKYMEMVRRGVGHCLRGDVFQIVLSRRFEQRFTGDDFRVYRALRSVNPSPYLFYFDFGSYRIFGSSPETHLRVEGDRATIDPIAGTLPRTGDDERDEEQARRLLADPKENAEHVMLVDLARNDLSRNASDVQVASYKQVQFYSHVIHMVSRVTGRIAPEINRIALFAGTFPAGTLSGAPKVRAMQLIDEIERHPRGFYGGCIGVIGFDGSMNQAITIRSFLSRGNRLCFQAGAGVVAKSDPASELAEVNNKLGALHRAIEIANKP
ncbi:MAG: anthranilate synthase component I family protein [Rikenellaceae bacterium]|jgi:anthranilate synthase component 1|nr:anthranilate synthase component I family protein [Rikenellaceae bacterium]